MLVDSLRCVANQNNGMAREMVARVVGRRLQLWICERKRREEERKKKLRSISLFFVLHLNFCLNLFGYLWYVGCVTFGAHLCGVLNAMVVYAECVSEDAIADECRQVHGAV